MFTRQQHTTLNKENQDFFNKIYQRYHKAIYANICKIIQDPQGVEDVFQEVFMALWINLHKAENVASIAPWLFVVSHNKSISCLRKKLKESIFVSEQEVAILQTADTTIDQEEITSHQLSIIRNAVAQLPDKRKEVFQLNKFEGKSVEEIASELELSPATVKEYLKQSIRLVRTYLQTAPGASSIATVLLLFFVG
ncbi:RNA polymerase sigma factor [Filimonas effusa]|uniref:RNA polymerase sigma factor n=1 Tax=Filimonas effusa TaxID=2508721 RepID=UPI0013E9863E|nr:sigma-70 family RNA polymerase sigma factor [Filimonas effusa]